MTFEKRRMQNVEPTESQMNTAGTAPLPARTKFVLVNDRVPGADACCALCCEKIEQGYVRATQTRFFYCDARCFAGHEKMAALVIERRARQVS
jgi:hypothetical protein